MKIVEIRAWLEALPLTKPYTIAYKTITSTEIVFFEVVLDNGMRGLGSANPFEEVVGETPLQTLQNLQQPFFQNLVGRDIRHFNQIIDETIQQYPIYPGTVAALDIAMHDAFCQYIDVSVVNYLGRKIEVLPTSITIGIKPTQEMLEEAAANYAAGFKVMKIKTGNAVEEDIERVIKLHEKFGNQIRLRVDANQGYDIPALQKFIQATNHIQLELIEQPLPSGKDTLLQTLSEQERKLLAADESLKDAYSALALAQAPIPYGIFNIKLMKCGGITGAKNIAKIAELSGIQLFWGCNDESMASITAALHVAYSCNNTRYLDLDGSFDLSRDWVTEGFIVKDGMMYCNNLPGLGLKRID
ncbi:MAG: hypothetical protein RLY16_2762 [Bacteroidota bacterium]